MSEPDRVLTTLTRTQGANLALKDGTVTPAGFSLKFEEIPVLVKGFRRMVRALEFDVSEMALTTYLTAREHGVAFTALPVFLVRGFHHGAIRYNTRSGIGGPNDLEGRRVALLGKRLRELLPNQTVQLGSQPVDLSDVLLLGGEEGFGGGEVLEADAL